MTGSDGFTGLVATVLEVEHVLTYAAQDWGVLVLSRRGEDYWPSLVFTLLSAMYEV